MTDHFIATADDMIRFGDQLARICLVFKNRCIIIHLAGELGAGKTTLVRGFLRAYGYQGSVKSPTYTLVEPYEIENRKIYHFDLYRLIDPEELEYMGIRDYTHDNAICLIEWADKGGDFVPRADLTISIVYHNQNNRFLNVTAFNQLGEQLLL